VGNVRLRTRSCRCACTRTAIELSVRSCFVGTASCRHRPTSSCGSRTVRLSS